jgi:hypothetical protein
MAKAKLIIPTHLGPSDRILEPPDKSQNPVFKGKQAADDDNNSSSSSTQRVFLARSLEEVLQERKKERKTDRQTDDAL